MVLNEDFFDDTEHQDIITSTPDPEDTTLYDEASSYPFYIVFTTEGQNDRPSVSSLAKFSNTLRYYIGAADIITECSQPLFYISSPDAVYDENGGVSDSIDQVYTKGKFFIKYGLSIRTQNTSVFVKRLYNLFEGIWFRLASGHVFNKDYNAQSFDFITSDGPTRFTRYDFSPNRREENVFKNFGAVFKSLVRSDYDYDQLKACMKLDTVHQLYNIAFDNQHDGYKKIDIPLTATDSDGFYDAKSLSEEFFDAAYPFTFYEEPVLSIAPRVDSTYDKDNIIKWVNEYPTNKIKVKPYLRIAVRGKLIYFMAFFSFNKTYKQNEYQRFAIAASHSFKYTKNQDERINAYWLAVVLKPFVRAGESPDDLLYKLEPYINTVFMDSMTAVEQIKEAL